MSDSVKKYFEDNPPVGHFGSNASQIAKIKLKKMMAKEKLITEELIDERLEARGVKFDIEHDEALKVIQDHYDFELTDNWNNTPDFSIYAETTADGYEVWVATNGDGRNVCINEDVHYYDNDLSEKLAEAMTDYNELIYVDDLESYYVQDAVTEVYDEYVNDMKQEVENELIEEGYEYEKETKNA